MSVRRTFSPSKGPCGPEMSVWRTFLRAKLVDARSREVLVLVLRDGAYHQGLAFAEGETFESSVVEGLRVEVASLFP